MVRTEKVVSTSEAGERMGAPRIKCVSATHTSTHEEGSRVGETEDERDVIPMTRGSQRHVERGATRGS